MKHKLELLKKEEIMKNMQIRYTKYFKHWKDFDLLTCILSMVGLILAVFDVSILSFISCFFSTRLSIT